MNRKLPEEIPVSPLPPQKERVRIPEEKWPRQNIPIESNLKIHRVYQKEPINETCWAYMKLLRETGNMKRTFDIDPYVEVYQFRSNLYGILTESADGMGDPWMYLVIGPEKAMLIDTGFGIGDLKGVVDELTGGMPLIVVNTHKHYDHAYGNCQFDTVYCHEIEAQHLLAQDEHLWDYLFEEGTGRCIWAEFDRNDIVPFQKYKVVPCPDGYVFNLGEDYEIELIHMGGHTPGHAGYLDKKNRIFFAGDNVTSMHMNVNDSLKNYRDRIGYLASRIDEFDHVFPGHFVTDLESSVIANLYQALNEIINDPEQGSKSESVFGMSYNKYVEGLGTISYTLPVT